VTSFGVGDYSKPLSVEVVPNLKLSVVAIRPARCWLLILHHQQPTKRSCWGFMEM